MADSVAVYIVNFTARAERDVAQLYERIHAFDSEAAAKWYMGFKKKVLALEHYPARCPLFRRKSALRALRYGRKPNVYLVIYRIREKTKAVDVLHIRHGSRRQPMSSELQ